jgi:hypothetical protein
MRVWTSLLTACAALTAAGYGQDVRSAGATDWFGQGIVAIRQSGTELQLDLRTEAQGMILRLAENEPITIAAVGPFAAGQSVVRLPPTLGPQRVQVRTDATSGPINPDQTDIAMTSSCLKAQGEGRTGMSAPGAASVNGQPTVLPSGICVRTVRTQPTPATTSVLRAPPREYLLLVLADRAPDSTVISRIRSIPGFDPATAAHDLAEFLVGRQTPMWAGYLARR